MSLDMSLYNKSGACVAEMNWLRNPFGLCQWAEDNTVTFAPNSLHDVCNAWAYANSNEVNRPLFLSVVNAYWQQVQALEDGYFYFTLSSYRQFIEPNMHALPTDNLFTGMKYIIGTSYDNKGRMRIPMQHFSHRVFNLEQAHTLDYYKKWFSRLVDFAEQLQNPELEFYCSN